MVRCVKAIPMFAGGTLRDAMVLEVSRESLELGDILYLIASLEEDEDDGKAADEILRSECEIHISSVAELERVVSARSAMDRPFRVLPSCKVIMFGGESYALRGSDVVYAFERIDSRALQRGEEEEEEVFAGCIIEGGGGGWPRPTGVARFVCCLIV
jgi:hypothetical protein